MNTLLTVNLRPALSMGLYRLYHKEAAATVQMTTPTKSIGNATFTDNQTGTPSGNNLGGIDPLRNSSEAMRTGLKNLKGPKVGPAAVSLSGVSSTPGPLAKGMQNQTISEGPKTAIKANERAADLVNAYRGMTNNISSIS